MICGAPAVIALPILALARLAARAKPEPEVHNHYRGPVRQEVHTDQRRAVWQKNINRK